MKKQSRVVLLNPRTLKMSFLARQRLAEEYIPRIFPFAVRSQERWLLSEQNKPFSCNGLLWSCSLACAMMACSSPEAAMRRAVNAYYVAGDYSRAKSVYTKLIDKDRRSGVAYYGLGRTLG